MIVLFCIIDYCQIFISVSGVLFIMPVYVFCFDVQRKTVTKSGLRLEIVIKANAVVCRD